MREHEQEDSTMLIDVFDGFFATAKALRTEWNDAMNVICKDEYVPAIQVRTFVQQIRTVHERVQDFVIYANTLHSSSIAQPPAIVVGINIYNDTTRISSALEELKIFVTRHIALTDEDGKQFKNILNEIDDTLLCLMYAGEYLQKRNLRSALEILSDTQNPVLES